MSAGKLSKSRAIAVVGMHRSGTSAMTRVLNLLGVDLGKRLLPPGRGNRLGHWEHQDVVDLHENLLHELDMTWDETRPMPEGWQTSAAAQTAVDNITELVTRDFLDSGLWAVKDPRLCRLLPLWTEALTRLGIELRVLFVMRHPAEVAGSLQARDDMDAATARLIWLQHVAEPEQATRDLMRSAVLYDDLLSDWKKAVTHIRRDLHLRWPKPVAQAASDINAFLKPGERHNVVEDDASAPLVAMSDRMYRLVTAVAHGSNDWSAVSVLVDKYGDWAPTFLGDIERRSRHTRVLTDRLQNAEDTVHAKEAQIAGQDESSRGQERQIYGLLETVHGKDAQIQRRDDTVHDKEAEITRRDQVIRDKDGQLQTLADQLTEKDRQIFGLLETVHGKDQQIQNHDGIVREKDDQIRHRDRILQDRDKEVAYRDDVIRDKNAELSRRDDAIRSNEGQIHSLNAHLNEKAQRQSAMENELQEKDGRLHETNESLQVSEKRIAELSHALESRVSAVAQLEQQATQTRARLKAQVGEIHERDQLIAQIHASKSWRLTRPLRAIRRALAALRLLFSTLSNRQSRAKYLWLARKVGPKETWRYALAYLRRGGPREPLELPQSIFYLREHGQTVILTTGHCLFIAQSIAHALERIGVTAKIIQQRPEAGYEDVPHFVICPQMFEQLPGLYVAFQMEQSVSTRWFTQDYIRMLENSFAIFDYSIINIKKLTGMGLSPRQFFYLPVGPIAGYGSAADHAHTQYEYDVIFYGDTNNQRRQAFLAAIKNVCKVKVVGNLFGAALHKELRKAKLVVNIHYYEGALLETTRLWECLSLGKFVVSERSSDMAEQEELAGLVDFVDVGDMDGMVERVRYWLDAADEAEERVRANDETIRGSFNRFDFFFYRFMLYSGNLNLQEFWNLVGDNLPAPSDKLCLNLPEYVDRAEAFDMDNRYGFTRFPGLKHPYGWVGCAMSYKFMAMWAKKHKLSQLVICEDDVEFPVDFDVARKALKRHLSDTRDDWDLFSGILADLHEDVKVLDSHIVDGQTYVVLDRMISTVYNIYNPKALNLLANWDDENHDVVSNTIDRYLERCTDLRVMTTSPFLVGHKEELYSTLWGMQNTQYIKLIEASQDLLKRKVEKWRVRHAAKA